MLELYFDSTVIATSRRGSLERVRACAHPDAEGRSETPGDAKVRPLPPWVSGGTQLFFRRWI